MNRSLLSRFRHLLKVAWSLFTGIPVHPGVRATYQTWKDEDPSL